MADDYFSWTLPFPESEIPIDLATADGHELPDSIGAAMGQPDALLTMSRADWLNGALAEVESWLTTAARSPERFVAPLCAACAEHIAQEVRDAFDLTEKREDEPEGDRPIYFFSFLQGLRTVLIDAQARGVAVLHVRYVHLFSKNS